MVHVDDFLRQFVEAIRRLDLEERANLVTLLLRVMRRTKRGAGGQPQAMPDAGIATAPDRTARVEEP